MACFLVSAAEALVVKGIEKHEETLEKAQVAECKGNDDPIRVPLSRKLKWLTWMLWGGAALLLFEHVWHGEIVPWFPFLSAMSSPAETAVMLQEIATTGVAMAAIVTVTWLLMCKAADSILARNAAASKQNS